MKRKEAARKGWFPAFIMVRIPGDVKARLRALADRDSAGFGTAVRRVIEAGLPVVEDHPTDGAGQSAMAEARDWWSDLNEGQRGEWQKRLTPLKGRELIAEAWKQAWGHRDSKKAESCENGEANQVNAANLDAVWARLCDCAGEEFRTKTGKSFTYQISENAMLPSRTDYRLPKADFAKALALVPFEGPGAVNKVVRGPSYIWAVLHDPRIRRSDW